MAKLAFPPDCWIWRDHQSWRGSGRGCRRPSGKGWRSCFGRLDAGTSKWRGDWLASSKWSTGNENRWLVERLLIRHVVCQSPGLRTTFNWTIEVSNLENPFLIISNGENLHWRWFKLDYLRGSTGCRALQCGVKRNLKSIWHCWAVTLKSFVLKFEIANRFPERNEGALLANWDSPVSWSNIWSHCFERELAGKFADRSGEKKVRLINCYYFCKWKER